MAERAKSPWTPERVGLLKELAGQGLAMSAIAKRLNCGVSRDAVIGKLNRIGFELPAETTARAPMSRKAQRRAERGTPSLGGPGSVPNMDHYGRKAAKRPLQKRALKGPQEPRGRKPARLVPLASVDSPEILFADGFEGQKGRVSLMDLTGNHCHFPITMATGEQRYCGLGPVEGSSYCAVHKARCHSGTTRVIRNLIQPDQVRPSWGVKKP